jgi:hypothetical protein
MSTPSSLRGTVRPVPGDDAPPAAAVDADLADVLVRLDRLEAVAARLDARLDADPDSERDAGHGPDPDPDVAA